MWSDVVAAQVPRYVAVWDNIRHGLSPFWWRNMFGGFNELGAGQSGIFYPPNAIFGFLSPTNAFRWWFFGHIWATTVGWYIWSLRRWQSILGATVCGIAATINGFVIYHSSSMPFIAAWALLPFAFLTLDRLIETARLRYVAILAALIAGIAIQLAQFLWLTLIALGVCTLFSLWRRGTGIGPWLRVGSAVLLGVGLAAVQLLPSAAFSQTSVRPTLTRAAAFEFSMEPRHLTTLLVPNIMGGADGLWWKTPWRGGPLVNELATYLGITIVALAVIGVIRLGRNRLSMALVTLAVLGVLSSMGGRTFIGNIFFDILPFANRFRGWARNLLWTYIAVTMLAGAGAREVARMPRRWAIRLTFGAVGFGAVMLLLPSVTDLGGAMLHGRQGALAATHSGPVPPRAGRCGLGDDPITNSGLGGTRGGVRARSRAVRVHGAVAQSQSQAVRGFCNDQRLPATVRWGGPPTRREFARWVSDVPDASALWPSVIGHSSDSVNGYDPLLQADYSASTGYMAYLGYMPDHFFWQGGWLPDVLRVTTLLASPYAGDVSSRFTFSHDYDLPTYSAIAPSTAVYNYSPRLAESYLIGATPRYLARQCPSRTHDRGRHRPYEVRVRRRRNACKTGDRELHGDQRARLLRLSDVRRNERRGKRHLVRHRRQAVAVRDFLCLDGRLERDGRR